MISTGQARGNSGANASIWRQEHVLLEQRFVRPRCAQLPFPAGRNGHYAAVQLRLSVRITMAAESCGLVLCKRKRLCYTLAAREYLCRSFLGSSAVEHPTVNRMVAGSNPARGARGFF